MTLPKRWRILGYFCGSITLFAALLWTSLYVESIHQRHRAEALIADLKNFPFDTATFATARDFSLRHGGKPIFIPELSQDPHIPVPPHLNWEAASSYDRVCAPKQCAFGIAIGNLSWIQQLPYSVAHPLILSLHSLGIRTWSVFLGFEVVDDHVAHSSTYVNATLEGPPTLDGSRWFDTLQYSAFSMSPASVETYPPFTMPVGQTYWVSARFYTKSPRRSLQTHFLQLPSAPLSRAYDIDLGCLTALTSTCTHAKLAPSAWSDLPKPRK